MKSDLIFKSLFHVIPDWFYFSGISSPE